MALACRASISRLSKSTFSAHFAGPNRNEKPQRRATTHWYPALVEYPCIFIRNVPKKYDELSNKSYTQNIHSTEKILIKAKRVFYTDY